MCWVGVGWARKDLVEKGPSGSHKTTKRAKCGVLEVLLMLQWQDKHFDGLPRHNVAWHFETFPCFACLCFLFAFPCVTWSRSDAAKLPKWKIGGKSGVFSRVKNPRFALICPDLPRFAPIFSYLTKQRLNDDQWANQDKLLYCTLLHVISCHKNAKKKLRPLHWRPVE